MPKKKTAAGGRFGKKSPKQLVRQGVRRKVIAKGADGS